MDTNITLAEAFDSLVRVARFRPVYTVGIILLSITTAILEGIGTTFILPIMQHMQSGDAIGGEGFILATMESAYDAIGIPFTLNYVIVGAVTIITVRYFASFLVAWLRHALRSRYTGHLQSQTYDRVLNARASYFDNEGSDDIINGVVTQARQAGDAIRAVVQVVEKAALSLMYFGIALYLAPVFTIVTGIVVGAAIYAIRVGLESGYDIGDRVATANENIQRSVQAGTQGIRDAKVFNLEPTLFERFDNAISSYVRSMIKVRRNQAAIANAQEYLIAVCLFVLIYAAIQFTNLSIGGLSVFFFAMFRLAPQVSGLNNLIYQLESKYPHLVRTHRLMDNLEQHRELESGTRPVPDPVRKIAFEDVSFGYGEEQILNDISFEVNQDELVAFVGSSGAGKSTIVSLLARLYEHDDGEIFANGIPVDKFPIDEWRSRVSVVRQNPFIFNETLWWNLTLGSDISEETLEEVCEIARVSEFLPELSDGLDTELGDDGVRLSGGQRQRVALARALATDGDLLVLDEATSNLDTEIESEVQSAIESMDRNYAVIVIAHRLSTVTNADRIYTMSDGRIVEIGRHEELIKHGGEYADLYSVQT